MSTDTKTAEQIQAPKQAAKPNTGKTAAKKPISDQFVPGQTRCRIAGCGHIVLVKGTKKKTQPDGSVIIERSVKCQGPARHTYTLPQIIPAKKK